MASYYLEIDGVEKEIQSGSLSLRRPASGMGTLSFKIESSDGSYRAPLEAEVFLYEDAGTLPVPRMFGGVLLTGREAAQTAWGAPTLTEYSVSDFAIHIKRTVITATLAAGTLKSQIDTLIADHFGSKGITSHPSQADGPAMPMVSFDAANGKDVLDALALNAQAAGTPMVWRVDHSKQLLFLVPGTQLALWNVAEGDGRTIGDIIVERSHAEGFATRIIVKAGSGTAIQTETFLGDGIATTFTTDLPAEHAFEVRITRVIDIVSSNATNDRFTTLQNHGLLTGDRVMIQGHSGSTPNANSLIDRRVTVHSTTTFSIDGLNLTVGGTGGVVRDSVPIGPYRPELGAAWPFKLQWDPITHTVYQRAGETPVPDDSRLELTYNAQYPFQVIVTGSPAGTVDKTIEAPFAFTRAAAIAAGQAELARSAGDLQRVEYVTHDTGLEPAVVQTVVESFRALNDSCLITEISTTDVENILEHRVSLIAADKYMPGWRKVYQDWLGGGSSAGASVGTGSTVTEIPPGSSIVGQDRQVVYIDGDTARGGEAFEYDDDWSGEVYSFAEHRRARVAISQIEDDKYALALWNTGSPDLRENALTFFVGTDGEHWLRSDTKTGTGIFGIGTDRWLSLNSSNMDIDPGSIILDEYLRMLGLNGLGSTALRRRRETATFTITATTDDRLVYILDAATAQTVNLPALANFGVDTDTSNTIGHGRLYIFHNISTGTWTLDPNSTETIGPAGATTYAVPAGATVAIMGWRGTGSKWIVLWNGGIIPAAALSAPGSDGQVIYNNGGVLAGDAGLTFNDTLKRIMADRTGSGLAGSPVVARSTGHVALNPINADDQNVLLGMLEDSAGDWIVDNDRPGYAFNSSQYNSGDGIVGMEMLVDETAAVAAAFAKGRGFGMLGSGLFQAYQYGGLGTGAFPGCGIEIQRNDDNDGASGFWRVFDRDGNPFVFWIDGGALHMGTAAPTEDDSVPHSGGAVFTGSALLTADPGAPSNDTWWFKRTGAGPYDLSINFRIAGSSWSFPIGSTT